ncbi:ribosomal protein S18 acetylase RimI-like enzyme [Kribbella aluminosa]|uniref:Ribosomal protein S18 acetylase RimI-like enzyme n=1 Tax=Kribbella aluminosa TaxID=416017 RepID=A0ABS4UM25_9ACTN|nr:GNAT family N-acetyltransferase [Kribbella aluminosa]MBP2352702.1 ribosomal protein S18 acetylase RimI-like enzyme [Kribbella aluminosa]
MSGFAEYRPGAGRQVVDVVVRAAVDADLTRCAELIVSRTGGPVDVRRARLVADLERPDRYTVVAEIDGEVVGYALVLRHQISPTDPPNTAPGGYYLIGLIVAPEHRRHGIGELLTQERIRWTAERADEVYYFANVANGATLDLHLSFGFTEVTRDFSFPNAPLKPGTCVLLRAPISR